MTRGILTALLVINTALFVKGQSNAVLADSIRKKYNIPELGYAVVSSTQMYDLRISGVKKVNTENKEELTDKFRIGSNTKAITGFVAARSPWGGLARLMQKTMCTHTTWATPAPS